MTTTELVKKLAERLQISQAEARRLLLRMQETVVKDLESGKTVVMRGFGSYGTRKQEARLSFNPALRKRMRLPPKVVMFFRPSQRLKDNLAAGRSS
ncbi:HU family DNA-binding protein [candidate division KSB1 bacterium]|nr:HU family DNA-binding protein [candidate division KSB1 bacterium]